MPKTNKHFYAIINASTLTTLTEGESSVQLTSYFSQYKEVNGTESSHIVRFPWFGSHGKGILIAYVNSLDDLIYSKCSVVKFYFWCLDFLF
jgi:hypothetical protein